MNLYYYFTHFSKIHYTFFMISASPPYKEDYKIKIAFSGCVAHEWIHKIIRRLIYWLCPPAYLFRTLDFNKLGKWQRALTIELEIIAVNPTVNPMWISLDVTSRFGIQFQVKKWELVLLFCSNSRSTRAQVEL